MGELRDCPFCGDEVTPHTWEQGEVTVSCSLAGCPGGEGTIFVEQWNRRPVEDALRARVAELEAERDGLERKCSDRIETAKYRGAIEQITATRDSIRAGSSLISNQGVRNGYEQCALLIDGTLRVLRAELADAESRRKYA